MDFHITRCPLQHSKRIMLGTFRTIKYHFWGFLNPTPHFIPHLFYIRLMFLGSVRSPLHLKHLEPFGTLATIKPHLAPSVRHVLFYWTTSRPKLSVVSFYIFYFILFYFIFLPNFLRRTVQPHLSWTQTTTSP